MVNLLDTVKQKATSALDTTNKNLIKWVDLLQTVKEKAPQIATDSLEATKRWFLTAWQASNESLASLLKLSTKTPTIQATTKLIEWAWDLLWNEKLSDFWANWLENFGKKVDNVILDSKAYTTQKTTESRDRSSWSDALYLDVIEAVPLMVELVYGTIRWGWLFTKAPNAVTKFWPTLNKLLTTAKTAAPYAIFWNVMESHLEWSMWYYDSLKKYDNTEKAQEDYNEIFIRNNALLWEDLVTTAAILMPWNKKFNKQLLSFWKAWTVGVTNGLEEVYQWVVSQNAVEDTDMSIYEYSQTEEWIKEFKVWGILWAWTSVAISTAATKATQDKLKQQSELIEKNINEWDISFIWNINSLLESWNMSEANWEALIQSYEVEAKKQWYTSLTNYLEVNSQKKLEEFQKKLLEVGDELEFIREPMENFAEKTGWKTNLIQTDAFKEQKSLEQVAINKELETIEFVWEKYKWLTSVNDALDVLAEQKKLKIYVNEDWLVEIEDIDWNIINEIQLTKFKSNPDDVFTNIYTTKAEINKIGTIIADVTSAPIAENQQGLVDIVKNAVEPEQKTDLVSTVKEDIAPIKDVKKVWVVEKLANLEAQKANLESKVKWKPQLQRQINQLNRDIKAAKKDVENIPVRLEKAEMLPTEEIATVTEKALPPVKKQPRYTKKRIARIKKGLNDMIKERREEAINDKLWIIADKKVQLSKKQKLKLEIELVQERHMENLVDLIIKKSDEVNFSEEDALQIIFDDKILTEENKLLLMDIVTYEAPLIKSVKNKETSKKKIKSDVKKAPLVEISEAQARSILSYNPDLFADHKAHVNIVSKGLDAVKLQWARANLVDNIGWLMKSIVVRTPDWKRKTLETLYGEIVQQWQKIKNNVIAELNIEESIDKIEENWEIVNEAFEFVIANEDKYLTNEWAFIKDFLSDNIEDARNNNSQFRENVRLKKEHTSKAWVVFDVTGVEIESRRRALLAEKRKQIEADNPDASIKEITELKKEVEITEAEHNQIVNDVIAILPQNTQAFVKEFIWEYGKYNKWEVRDWYAKVWAELQEADLLKTKKLNKKQKEVLEEKWISENELDLYYRGYISLNRLNNYAVKKEELRKKANKSKVEKNKKISKKVEIKDPSDIMLEIVKSENVNAENISSILKRKKDLWYMHSYDPVTVNLNYANETGNLMKNKMVKDTLDNLWNKNPEVADFISDFITKKDSNVLKKMYWINERSGWWTKALNWTAFSTYVWNTNLLMQNMLTATTFMWMKWLSNLVEGKWAISKELLWNYNSTANYLYDMWLLAHKNIDIDLKWKWATTKSNLAKWVWERAFQEAMEIFTASLVRQEQVVLGGTVMMKTINDNWGMKTWETLAEAYERVLDWMTQEQEMDARGKLNESIVSVENTTQTSKAVAKIFDKKAFNMVKSWARETFSSGTNSIASIIDIWVEAAQKNEDWTRNFKSLKDSWIVWEIQTAVTKFVVPYILISQLAQMLFDTEDEQDEFKKRMVADSLWENFKYLAFNQFWPHWYSMFLDKISALYVDLAWWIVTAENLETRWKATKDAFFKVFNWLDKWLKTIQWNTVNTDSAWRFKFQDENYSWVLARFVNLSKEAAWYSQTVKRNIDERKEIEWVWAIKWTIDDAIIYLKRFSDKIVQSETWIWAVEFKNRVWNMNNRIHEASDIPMNFEDWVMNALWEEYAGSKVFTGKLAEKHWKDIERNLKIVTNLEKLLPEINAVQEITSHPDDFWATLEELRTKIPKLYNKFYKALYSSVQAEWLTSEATESQSAMLDNVIAKDMEWVRLKTSVSNIMQWTLEVALEDIRKWTWIKADTYDQLKTINDLLWLMSTTPWIKEQVYDSLSQLVPENLTKENGTEIAIATKDFPEIRKLYVKNAELRGAIFDETEEDIVLPELPPIWDGNWKKKIITPWLPQFAVPDKVVPEFWDLPTLDKKEVPNINPIVNPIREWLLIDLVRNNTKR